ncbi:MAG: hypothetical protein P4L99_26865 [Chthoniobacter sp.]|nr:hypothetical protein [Chthoniobacter sp.]
MKSKFTVVGIALLLCLPAFTIIGAGVAYFSPRQYFSKCTVEFRGTDRNEFVHAFLLAARPYSKSASLQEVRNTGLYEIGIYDADPRQAANKANGIATTLQEKLKPAAPPPPSRLPGNATIAEREAAALANAEAQMNARSRSPVVRIWEKAEPAAVPARPNVPLILFIAIAGGMVFAAFGAISLIVGLITRADNVPSLPKSA